VPGITAGLPQRAGVHDDVGFVMNAVCGIFLDARELACRSWGPLRSRLGGDVFEIVDLAL
jgi:hypothetical protein